MLLPVLEMGGTGVISVVSHLAGEEMQAMVAAAGRADWDDAKGRDAGLQDLIAALFVTSSPILIKAALEMTGLIPSGRLRLPLVEATPVERDDEILCQRLRRLQHPSARIDDAGRSVRTPGHRRDRRHQHG